MEDPLGPQPCLRGDGDLDAGALPAGPAEELAIDGPRSQILLRNPLYFEPWPGNITTVAGLTESNSVSLIENAAARVVRSGAARNALPRL